MVSQKNLPHGKGKKNRPISPRQQSRNSESIKCQHHNQQALPVYFTSPCEGMNPKLLKNLFLIVEEFRNVGAYQKVCLSASLYPPFIQYSPAEAHSWKRSCDAKSNSHWTEQRRCVRVRVGVSDSEIPYCLSWLFLALNFAAPCCLLISLKQNTCTWPGFLCAYLHRHLNS